MADRGAGGGLRGERDGGGLLPGHTAYSWRAGSSEARVPAGHTAFSYGQPSAKDRATAVRFNKGGAKAFDSGMQKYRPMAEAAYRRALRLWPGFAFARFNLATLLWASGGDDDLREALTHLRVAVATRPSFKEAHSDMAVLLLKLSPADGRDAGNAARIEEARLACLAALRCDPNHAAAHWNLASVLRRLGRKEAAVARSWRCLLAAAAKEGKDTAAARRCAREAGVGDDDAPDSESDSELDAATAPEFEVARHLKGTTYHRVDFGHKKDATTGKKAKINNWIKYWQLHTGEHLPKFCPGRKNEKKAHELCSYVGAHCIVTRGDESYFCIVPACRSCNNHNNEYPLVWQCKAVTILNSLTRNFVGKIHTYKTVTTADGKTKQKATTEYWRQINDMRVSFAHARSERTTLTISGVTNAGTETTCTYTDPDTFLTELALWREGKLKPGARSLNRRDDDFKPQILPANVGRWPKNRDAYAARGDKWLLAPAVLPPAEPPLAVVCVKWGSKYDAGYVNKLARAVKRHLSLPHEFFCFTENAKGVGLGTGGDGEGGGGGGEGGDNDDYVRTRPLPDNGWGTWWAKPAVLFGPGLAAALGGGGAPAGRRVLYIDLDTVIVGSLDGIAAYPGPFALLSTTGFANEGFDGGYNSSVVAFAAGWGTARVWAPLAALGLPLVRRFVHRFDHWLEMCAPGADALQDLFPGQLVEYAADCRGRAEGGDGRPPDGARVVNFPLEPKPHAVVASTPWVAEHWR